MIRKLTATLLLVLAAVAPAEEIPMFSVSLGHAGAVEVVSHQLELPPSYDAPAFMAVELRLHSGLVRTFRFEVPAEALRWTPGYVSHSYHFEAGGQPWYLGEVALWEPGLVLHVEPRVFLPQVRMSSTTHGLEFFLDTEVFQVVGRDLRRQGAFAALHNDR